MKLDFCIYKYEGPVIPFQYGEVWRINSVSKLDRTDCLRKSDGKRFL